MNNKIKVLKWMFRSYRMIFYERWYMKSFVLNGNKHISKITFYGPNTIIKE
jgi:hypothetical protein